MRDKGREEEEFIIFFETIPPTQWFLREKTDNSSVITMKNKSAYLKLAQKQLCEIEPGENKIESKFLLKRRAKRELREKEEKERLEKEKVKEERIEQEKIQQAAAEAEKENAAPENEVAEGDDDKKKVVEGAECADDEAEKAAEPEPVDNTVAEPVTEPATETPTEETTIEKTPAEPTTAAADEAPTTATEQAQAIEPVAIEQEASEVTEANIDDVVDLPLPLPTTNEKPISSLLNLHASKTKSKARKPPVEDDDMSYTSTDLKVGTLPVYLDQNVNFDESAANRIDDFIFAVPSYALTFNDSSGTSFQIDLLLGCPMASFSPQSFFSGLSIDPSNCVIKTLGALGENVTQMRFVCCVRERNIIKGKWGKGRESYIFRAWIGWVEVVRVKKLFDNANTNSGNHSSSFMRGESKDGGKGKGRAKKYSEGGGSRHRSTKSRDATNTTTLYGRALKSSIASVTDTDMERRRRDVLDVMELLGEGRVEVLRRVFFTGKFVDKKKGGRRRKGRGKGRRGEGKRGNNSDDDDDDYFSSNRGDGGKGGSSESDNSDSSAGSVTTKIIKATSTFGLSLPNTHGELHDTKLPIGACCSLLREMAVGRKGFMRGFVGDRGFGIIEEDDLDYVFNVKTVGEIVKCLHSITEIDLEYFECQVVGSVSINYDFEEDEEEDEEEFEEVELGEEELAKKTRVRVKKSWYKLTDKVMLSRGLGVLRFADFLAVVVFWFVEFANAIRDEQDELYDIGGDSDDTEDGNDIGDVEEDYAQT